MPLEFVPVDEPFAATAARLLPARRVLVHGAPGTGKSTLSVRLAQALHARGAKSSCIGADPGLPLFGAPGALARARWSQAGWRVDALEALCTLDAARFRLPLVQGVRRLAAQHSPGALLVDTPGVVRGVAGAELLPALVEAAAVDLVIVLAPAGRAPPLPAELAALGIETLALRAPVEARRLGKGERARARTRLWDRHLAAGIEHELDLAAVTLVGTPPPCEDGPAWSGRQVALLGPGSKTLALGEAQSLHHGRLHLRTTPAPGCALENVLAVLVRDAQRTPADRLESAPPPPARSVRYAPPPDMAPRTVPLPLGPRPLARIGSASALLVNGIFGDPLLHLRLRHRGRSVLFDLGEAVRLPARIAHQVSDVFISHAHFDHIGGFPWLLRSRIGEPAACRVFGPPGLADNIEGFVRGVHWDRIGERGPRFEVAELHGERLLCHHIQAGRPGVMRVGEVPAPGGVLLEDAEFAVRAVTLDHRTPVLAFAFVLRSQPKVRKDRLAAFGLAPGRWITELKARVRTAEMSSRILLPDGRTEGVEALARELLVIEPDLKLVYATDLADTTDNRSRLVALAGHAHTFFCEAGFAQAQAEHAMRTGHLTARACGEIAAAAGVERLIPFHFSRRYEPVPERIYDEVLAACPRTVLPGARLTYP